MKKQLDLLSADKIYLAGILGAIICTYILAFHLDGFVP
jgi:hypothetical protein